MSPIYLFYLLLSGVFASPITDDADAVYRLPTSVIPSAYTLDLLLEEDAFYTKTFQGVVSIAVTAVDVTKKVTLHAKFITVTHVNLVAEADPGSSLLVTGLEPNELTEQLTINLEKELQQGSNYTLTINYVGILSDNDMYGFYQSTYNDTSGITHYVASTQFETIHARRAFPSFDEPALKATFYVSITAPSGSTVLLNTPQEGEDQEVGNLVRKQFQRTPIMSTYLLAFVVSDFTKVTSSDGTVTMWARPGTENNRQIAVEYAAKLLATMQEWTKIPFLDHGTGKMDVVAIPDFAPGAMENWGIVTYKERLLIDDGNETALSDRGNIATVIAHEFSHSWFGDLVTTDWWSDLWLNEGFATFFEYHLTHWIQPDYNLDKKFLIDVEQPALQLDALYASLPVSSQEEDVNTPSDIDSKMDDITYYKGGSVIRMFRDFLGESIFQTGLQQYLADNKYKNTSPKILWTYFDIPESLPETMDVIMENWIFKSGYPLVTVATSNGTVHISQERFLIDDNKTDSTQWYVPINYTTAELQQTETSSITWLVPNKTLDIEHNANDWIIVNYKQSGFFRVNYDENLWGNILEVLNSSTSITDIDELNRAQIVDDLFNLARTGRVSYSFLFDFIGFLRNEDSYYVWQRAFEGFNFILNKFANTDLNDKINERIISLVGTLLASVPLANVSNAYTYTLKQSLAWTWACQLNLTECVDYALQEFNAYREQSLKPPSDFKYFIYCTAVQHTNNGSGWDFLWETAYLNSSSPAEQVTILNSLGCSQDEEVINRYLKLSITDGRIRKQDAPSVFRAVFERHPENTHTAYQFFKDNYQAAISFYKGLDAFTSILNDLANTLSEEDAEDLKEFASRPDVGDDFKVAATQALEVTQANVKWRNKYEPEIRKYFGVDASATKINAGLPLPIPLISSSRNLF